jgi:2-hydroxychromene-2-carboxylate isomerase
MATEFKDQGGFATSNPSAFVRWIGSKFATRLASVASLERRRDWAEKKRQRAGRPHRVEYFHQVDDGYSHLAAQLLRPILENYDVELVFHLVASERGPNLPEPDLLLALSRYDSAQVAPHYGLRFPTDAAPADPELVEVAGRILAAAATEEIPEIAVAVGCALWAADAAGMESLARSHGAVAATEASARIASGNARRAKLGHYSGAMFYYGGEWYWGADRLNHLENRLGDLGVRRAENAGLVCPRPAIEFGPLRDDGSLTFEIYPSLRSPYTSVIFDIALELGAKTGVNTVVRPVLPMVMRGVPATRQKGQYIFTDAAREARALGLEWGNFYDPIGDPVRKAYSLYPWAIEQGKGNDLLSSFMDAAFCKGVNTNSQSGLRTVVESAGLSWDVTRGIVGNRDWEDTLEKNRLAMYDFGSWGVPSFRLLDERGEQVLALWGQDRLWLFSREIQRLLRDRDGTTKSERFRAGRADQQRQ